MAMNPSEIARETLKQLALRRIPPTPDNYQMLYGEIAGTPITETFPTIALKQIVATLPTDTAEQLRYNRQLDEAIASGNWEALRAALQEIVEHAGGEPLPWGTLIKDVLTQFEVRNSGLTQAKKRDSLNHVLRASGSVEVLFQRLQNIIGHWSRSGIDDIGTSAEVDVPTSTEATPNAEKIEPTMGTASDGKPGSGDLRDLSARLLEEPIHALLHDTPELAEQSVKLAKAIRSARQEKQLTNVQNQLKQFSYRINYVVEDQAELKSGLLGVLQLLVQNIGEIVIDEQWLHGQISTVSELLNKPLELRTLDSVERQLKDVIYKQSALKKNLLEANDRLKQMLALFVDRLGDFSNNTGEYHDKIEACATRISQAKNATEISSVLEEVMRETRQIQLDTIRSHDEITQMRERATSAEKEIARLLDELSQASEMVRVDALTGTLNRKGMEEALQREVARTNRRKGQLSIALLDIDNFKQINDTLGHGTGDAALLHLATVTRETIRPQDTLARYGGEEFVILMPDTAMDDAVKAMERVQRELTRRYFMNDNNKLLITFSAGVSVLGETEENASDALHRADQAMYLAKRAGKNRVMAS
jgi:diguanylate cyclase